MYEVTNDSVEICLFSLSRHFQTSEAGAEEEGNFVRVGEDQLFME